MPHQLLGGFTILSSKHIILHSWKRVKCAQWSSLLTTRRIQYGPLEPDLVSGEQACTALISSVRTLEGHSIGGDSVQSRARIRHLHNSAQPHKPSPRYPGRVALELADNSPVAFEIGSLGRYLLLTALSSRPCFRTRMGVWRRPL